MEARQFVWSEDQAQQRSKKALTEIDDLVSNGERLDWGVLSDLVEATEEQHLYRLAKERLEGDQKLKGLLDHLKKQFVQNQFEGGSNPSARLLAEVRRKVVSEFVQKYEGWGS